MHNTHTQPQKIGHLKGQGLDRLRNIRKTRLLRFEEPILSWHPRKIIIFTKNVGTHLNEGLGNMLLNLGAWGRELDSNKWCAPLVEGGTLLLKACSTKIDNRGGYRVRVGAAPPAFIQALRGALVQASYSGEATLDSQ